jgi:type I restriction enzyme R subunit
MALVKRLKAAYDICSGSESISQQERDWIHFYLAVRSIVFKLTKGNAPDTAQMNARVREMIAEALKADGVEEIFKLGDEDASEVDIFDDEYLAKIEKIKLPNTKIKLLQQLLARAIEDFKKINKTKGMDFSEKFRQLVDHYNERKEDNLYVGEVWDDITNEFVDLIAALRNEKESFADLGIDIEEKSFYDILLKLANKYEFTYPEDKLLELSKAVKQLVDDKAAYTDWNQRDDIKAELKVGLILLLAKHGYPPVDKDEVYKEIFEQAENFKKYRPVTLRTTLKRTEPLQVWEKSLYTIEQVKNISGMIHVCDTLLRIDTPYVKDEVGLSLTGHYQSLFPLGVVNTDILAFYFSAEALVHQFTREYQSALSDYGVKQVIYLKEARAGSVEILIGIGVFGAGALKFLKEYPSYSDGFERLKSDLLKRWQRSNEDGDSPILLDVDVKKAREFRGNNIS